VKYVLSLEQLDRTSGGSDQLLPAVRQCWASLFTDCAIAYRARNNDRQRRQMGCHLH
jgi:phosphoenolpyruvate synthase/pyruvate phosphate dikinase